MVREPGTIFLNPPESPQAFGFLTVSRRGERGLNGYLLPIGILCQDILSDSAKIPNAPPVSGIRCLIGALTGLGAGCLFSLPGQAKPPLEFG